MVILLSHFGFFQNPKKSQEPPLVGLTMSPSAARLSFRSNVSSGGTVENQDKNKVLRPVAFRPHFAMSLALGLFANDLVGLPKAICPKEAFRKFEGLIHWCTSSLEVNGWKGKYCVDQKPKMPGCQEKPAQYLFQFLCHNEKMLGVWRTSLASSRF